jgi:DNA transposition AAA+ family ATPase
MNLNPGKTEFSADELADLRSRLKTVMRAQALAQAEVARQCEVADSTLSQWINGKYPGDQQPVAAKIHRWLKALEVSRETSRRLPTRPAFTPMHGSTEISNSLHFARATGSLVVIAGTPGISKTATSKQYASDNPGTWYAAMDPTTSGVPTMLLAVLAAMGAPDTKGTPQLLMREVRNRAAQIGDLQGLLIIDEAQHLTQTAIEALRAINDGIELGVALVGNEELYSKVGATGGKREFAQVSSRVAHRIIRLSPDPRDAETLANAWAEANGEVIDKRCVAYALTIAGKPGGLRNVSHTFRNAIFAARSVGEALDLSHLQGAFAQLSGTAAIR